MPELTAIAKIDLAISLLAGAADQCAEAICLYEGPASSDEHVVHAAAIRELASEIGRLSIDFNMARAVVSAARQRDFEAGPQLGRSRTEQAAQRATSADGPHAAGCHPARHVPHQAVLRTPVTAGPPAGATPIRLIAG
jgi:outer membrane murein-binding lipoprotein Lpp